MKNALIAALIILIGVQGYFFATRDDKPVDYSSEKEGVAAGTEKVETEFFNNGLVIGGTYSTSTSAATCVLPVYAFDTESTVAITLNNQDATCSFNASSTMGGFLPNTGMKKQFIVRNSTTTAAMDLTIAGGTGVSIKRAATSTGFMIPGDTDGANHALLTIERLANRNFSVSVNVYTD